MSFETKSHEKPALADTEKASHAEYVEKSPIMEPRVTAREEKISAQDDVQSEGVISRDWTDGEEKNLKFK